MTETYLHELVSCAGVEHWQLWAVHCVQNPRFQKKLKGKLLYIFQRFNFTL